MTDPAVRPVTRPDALTLATVELLLPHVTMRPVSAVPFASLGVAVSWTVWPIVRLAEVGLTLTEATGASVTVTVDVPLFPSLVAVIVVEPAALAVTSPVALTVAVVVLLLAQVIVRPVRALPAESLVVALSCVVAPTKSPAVAGLTVTEATGTFDTVTDTVALWPSLVAVIVADPAVTPLASPVALTAATAALLLAQVIVRPVRTLPAESLVVAVSCCVAPTKMLAVAGVTVTEATGTIATVTVTDAVALFPSLVTVMVADPAKTPLASPVALTAATAALLLAQVIVRPVRTFPAESLVVAVSCCVAPTTRLTVAGLRVTDATGTVETVTAAVPLCPSLVAVTVTDPAAAPVTSPAPVTVASVVLELAQVTERPVNTLPAESFVVAVSCTVPPTTMFPLAGLTVTEATGTRATAMLAVPLFPSLVAVMVAEPAPLATTSPSALTRATVVSLDAQVIKRPVSTFPAASLVVAVSCFVAPTRRLAVAGLRVTDATGTLETVTVAVPLCPSLVAVIIADPAVIPLASPVALTAATAALLLAQVIVRPVRTFPAESLVVAESWTVAPSSTLAVAGVSVTDATGTVATVTAAVPLCPSLAAVIVAAPTPIDVTSPLAFTVATPALLLAHVTVRPVSGLPFPSSGVAVSCVVAPTCTVVDAGLTTTRATGTGGGGVWDSTVIAAESFLLPLDATMNPEPTCRPCTMPVWLTLARALILLVQLRPCGGWLLFVTTVAVSWILSLTSTVSTRGVREMDPTPRSGPSALGNCSQAANKARQSSPARCQLVGKRMNPSGARESEVRRLDWHGTRKRVR